MLMRTIDPINGAYNGTRLKLINIRKHLLECKILTGPNAGKIIIIPRISSVHPIHVH